MPFFMEPDDLLTRFGELERVYRPSPGQTFAGVFVCLIASAVCILIALLSDLDTTNRVCAAILSLGALGGAYWLFRQRRWRIAIFSEGLVQVRPVGVDQVRWSQVREIVQTRLAGHGDRIVRITLVARHGNIVVNPVNYRSRSRLFAALVAAAEKHQIPVRIELEQVD